MSSASATGICNPKEAPAPYFDSEKNAWVLNRYVDVLAALREPALQQMSELGSSQSPTDARAESSHAIAQVNLNEYATVSSFESLIDRLPVDRTIDLVGDLLRPWSVHCFTSLVRNTFGMDFVKRYDLRFITRHASGGESDARKTDARSKGYLILKLAGLAWQQRRADANLTQLVKDVGMPGLKSVFLGITQTFPGFLANAWLALLQNPNEMRRLRTEPEAVPPVIEDLLRTAGLVHTLTRAAAERVTIANAIIEPGQTVLLKIGSANSDPAQFEHADSTHIGQSNKTRRAARHLALGAGAHSCVGASFVRKAAASATLALLKGTSHIELAGPIEWSRGAVLSYPLRLPVRLQRSKS